MATQAAQLPLAPSALAAPAMNSHSPSPVHSTDDEEQIVWKKSANGTAGSATDKTRQQNASDGYNSKRASDPWHFNQNEQMADSRSSSGWELSDELSKLRINDSEARSDILSMGGKAVVSNTPDSGRATSNASRSSTDKSLVDANGDAPAMNGVAILGRPDQITTEPLRSSPPRASPTGGFAARKENTTFIPNNQRLNVHIPAGRVTYPFMSNGAVQSPIHVHPHQLPAGGLHSPHANNFPLHIQTVHGHVPQPQFSPHIPNQRNTARMPDMDYSARPDGMPKNGVGATNGANFGMGGPYGSMNRPQDHSAGSYDMGQTHNGSYGTPGGQGYHSPTVVSPPHMPSAQAYPAHMAHLGHYGAPPPHGYPHPYGAPPGSANSYELAGQGSGMDNSRAPLNAALANRPQFRGHQHSASDPATLRDPAPMMGNESGMHIGQHQQATSPLSLSHSHSLSLSLSHSPYSPQLPASPYHPHSPGPYSGYYGHIPPPPQMAHSQPSQDMINAMSNMSPTYPGSPYPSAAHGSNMPSGDPSLGTNGSGPSANNRKLGLYKTELCRSWEEKGTCRYGSKCQFAHGEDEVRKVTRHPKYKTEICRTFWVSGSCPYGKRCCFVHTELPGGAAGAMGGAPAEGTTRSGSTPGGSGSNAQGGSSAPPDGRARSMSTNSDPNEAPSSLLARISAKAHANNAAAAAAVAAANRSSDASPANGQFADPATTTAIANAYAQYGRPAQSNLRVDTAASVEKDTYNSASNLPSFQTTTTTTPGSGGHSGGMHHRVSASVDFGGHGRHLGESLDLGPRGMGHQRNPSASSLVHSAYHSLVSNDSHVNSRTPDSRLSGHSTPYGSTAETTTPARASPAPPTTRSFMHERSSSGGISLGFAMDRAWA